MSRPDPEPRDRDAARRRLVALLSAADEPRGSSPGPRPIVVPSLVPAPEVPTNPRTRAEGALEAAAARYADAYGMLPGPEHARPRTRWRVAPRTVAAAALALVLVAGGIALRSTLSRPGEPVELPVPAAVPGAASSAPSAGPGPAAPGAAATAGAAAPMPAHVVVDVTGAVRRPGVVTLPVGSRVVDAVDAAGGATPDADLSRLNLARVLVDGEQVVVATPDDPLPATPLSGTEAPGPDGGDGTGEAGALLDLNTADEAALDTLPGIGPVLAARIVEHRATQPFASVEDLEDVPGIGPALMGELRSLVTV